MMMGAEEELSSTFLTVNWRHMPFPPVVVELPPGLQNSTPENTLLMNLPQMQSVYQSHGAHVVFQLIPAGHNLMSFSLLIFARIAIVKGAWTFRVTSSKY
jgi:hypothetical protein